MAHFVLKVFSGGFCASAGATDSASTPTAAAARWKACNLEIRILLPPAKRDFFLEAIFECGRDDVDPVRGLIHTQEEVPGSRGISDDDPWIEWAGRESRAD